MNVQFRVHRPWCDVSGQLVSVFETYSETGFMFEHPPDEKCRRIHVHGFLFNPTATRKTISAKLQETLNLKGNEEFFTSDKCGESRYDKDRRELDISGAFWYGSKADTIAPVYLKNISPDLLESLRIHSRQNRTIMNIARNTHTTELVVLKEIKVKTKPTLYQHAKQCTTNIMDKGALALIQSPNYHTFIFTQCIEYLKSQELFMGRYKQLDFMDQVLLMLGDKSYETKLYEDFLKRTNPN